MAAFSSRSFYANSFTVSTPKQQPNLPENQLLLLNGGHCQALCHEFWCDSDRLRPI